MSRFGVKRELSSSAHTNVKFPNLGWSHSSMSIRLDEATRKLELATTI